MKKSNAALRVSGNHNIEKARIVLTPILARAESSRIKKQLETERLELRKEYDSIQKGSLYIRYRNSHRQFIKRMEGRLYGITNELDTVYGLARKQFLQLGIELLEIMLENKWEEGIDYALSEVVEEIDALLTKYENAGLDIDLISMTPNQRIWNSDRHSKSNYRREELKYPTKKGRVFMRSKSEQAIGNLLEMLHVAYRYEPEITINSIAYHPDFVIMLPNGRLIILEHVGRMDLKDYRERLIQRLQAYDSIGLLIGRNVFMSFEHDTRDEVLIKEVLFQMMTSDPTQNHVLQRAAVKAGCSSNIA